MHRGYWVILVSALGCGPTSMGSDAEPGHDSGGADAGSFDASVPVDAHLGDAGSPSPIAWDWEWINRRPQGNPLHGVDMSSAADGWAVGSRGTALHYVDGAWSVVATPTTENLRSVDAITSDHAWAVGDDGAVLRWNGTGWIESTPFTSRTLYRVWAPSSDFAIAVGTGAFQWNGEAWSPLDIPDQDAWFSGVHGLSPDDFWLAGPGTLLHCVDAICTPVTLNYMTWVAVHAFAEDDVWLAGDAGHVAHWDGIDWSDVTLPGLTSSGVSIYSAARDDVWIGTMSGVFRFDGDTWARIDPTAASEASQVGGADGTVLAVGNGLFHDDGSGLVADAPDRVRNTVNAIWGTSGDDLWLGMIGGPGVQHYDGTDIAPATDPTLANTRTQSIHGTAADDVWFLGVDNYATYWDGDSATMVAIPSFMYAIFALERGHAIAVGAEAIIEIEDGTATTVFTPAMPLNAVWASGLDDAYAVGNGGAIYHFDGDGWTAMESPTEETLTALCGRSASEVFATGAGGVLLRLRDGVWESIPSPADASFNGIALEGAHTWLVGTEPASGAGEIWRFDGTQLVEVQPGTAGYLRAIVALPDGELWTAGFFSHVLRRPAQ